MPALLTIERGGIAVVSPNELSPFSQAVVSIASVIGIVAAAATAYLRGEKKETRPGSDEAVVVSATFSDRKTMQNLTSAIEALTVELIEARESIVENSGLLKADAQRRHDEAIIREALRARGITD